MAIGLDLLIVAGTGAYKLVAQFANPALIVALLWPQRLAFLAATTVLSMTCRRRELGASIPALIYAGTQAWAALTIESRRAA